MSNVGGPGGKKGTTIPDTADPTGPAAPTPDPHEVPPPVDAMARGAVPPRDAASSVRPALLSPHPAGRVAAAPAGHPAPPSFAAASLAIPTRTSVELERFREVDVASAEAAAAAPADGRVAKAVDIVCAVEFKSQPDSNRNVIFRELLKASSDQQAAALTMLTVSSSGSISPADKLRLSLSFILDRGDAAQLVAMGEALRVLGSADEFQTIAELETAMRICAEHVTESDLADRLRVLLPLVKTLPPPTLDTMTQLLLELRGVENWREAIPLAMLTAPRSSAEATTSLRHAQRFDRPTAEALVNMVDRISHPHQSAVALNLLDTPDLVTALGRVVPATGPLEADELLALKEQLLAVPPEARPAMVGRLITGRCSQWEINTTRHFLALHTQAPEFEDLLRGWDATRLTPEEEPHERHLTAQFVTLCHDWLRDSIPALAQLMQFSRNIWVEPSRTVYLDTLDALADQPADVLDATAGAVAALLEADAFDAEALDLFTEAVADKTLTGFNLWVAQRLAAPPAGDRDLQQAHGAGQDVHNAVLIDEANRGIREALRVAPLPHAAEADAELADLRALVTAMVEDPPPGQWRGVEITEAMVAALRRDQFARPGRGTVAHNVLRVLQVPTVDVPHPTLAMHPLYTVNRETGEQIDLASLAAMLYRQTLEFRGGDEATSARDRSTLLIGFLRALASAVEYYDGHPGVAIDPHGRVVCGVGLAQRIMQVFQGFLWRISVDQINAQTQRELLGWLDRLAPAEWPSNVEVHAEFMRLAEANLAANGWVFDPALRLEFARVGNDLMDTVGLEPIEVPPPPPPAMD